METYVIKDIYKTNNTGGTRFLSSGNGSSRNY